MQATVETKKQYVEPKVVELGNVATITLSAMQGGSSGSVTFTLLSKPA